MIKKKIYKGSVLENMSVGVVTLDVKKLPKKCFPVLNFRGFSGSDVSGNETGSCKGGSFKLSASC